MPVRIGESYVTEAALEFAKTQKTERDEKDISTKKGNVLSELQEKFKGLNITIGTKPFSGTGTNNVSISPKILKQMENDPEKRMEYEALLYDVSNTDLAQGRNIKSAGWIIHDDGGLSAWSIGVFDDKNQSSVKRSENKNWWQSMLDKYSKKKKLSMKESQAKILEKAKEKTAEKIKLKKNEAATVEISPEARKILTMEKTMEKSFADVNELSKYLFQNYDIVNKGMSKISSQYLRDCVKDKDKLQVLFDNLSAADKSLKEKQNEVGFQGMKINIDENGEVTMESSKSTIGFNGEKIKRQMAAAVTQRDMEVVLKLLEQDIENLENGLKNNMCDAAEVQKAKDMLIEAKEKMANLPNRESTPEEQAIVSLNMLI